MSNELVARKPVDVVISRLQACQWQFETHTQTAYAIIGALEQEGWVIVRKRHMRLPK